MKSRLLISSLTWSWVGMSALLLSPAVQATSVLQLRDVITAVIANDPWLEGNTLREQALQQQAGAAGTWAAPKVGVKMQNVPVDTFALDQDNMTQLQVSVSQALPRGESLKLAADKLTLQAQLRPMQRLDRQARLTREATLLWLDAYLASRSIALIEQNKSLFVQLEEVVASQYRSGEGRQGQQALLRAEVELAQLEDRLAQWYQQREATLMQLQVWMASDATLTGLTASQAVALPATLPVRLQHLPEFTRTDIQQLITLLSKHPQLLAARQKTRIQTQEVALAREQFKPQWQLEASYGFRQNEPEIRSRADVMSVGVTVDVPWFTQQRLHRDVTAAIRQHEASKTDERLVLQQLLREARQALSLVHQLRLRLNRFQQQILPGLSAQTEAALQAYTTDNGDFAEVMRARIAKLDALLQAEQISVSLAKTLTKLTYLLPSTADVRPTGTHFHEK